MTDSWGRRLYLASATMMIIMGLVHSISLFTQPVAHNDTERQLNDLLNNYRFNALGSMRSMQDFLQGFSISFMLAALVLGALAFAVSRERLGLLKRVALVNILWLVAMLATSLRYFFIVPTSFLSVTLLLFVLAWFKLPADQPS
jgi:hypothetical protein